MAKLKVYRTAIGFHDAYVAAASQKAALDAWGSDKNLFARGAAELVTDEALTAGPLASPGRVIKRLRGTADEQMAALPANEPRRAKAGQSAPGARTRAAPAKRKMPPPPSRSALEKAEEALARVNERGRAKLDELDRRQAELTRQRRETMEAITLETERATADQECEADQYDRAIKRWRADPG